MIYFFQTIQKQCECNRRASSNKKEKNTLVVGKKKNHKQTLAEKIFPSIFAFNSSNMDYGYEFLNKKKLIILILKNQNLIKKINTKLEVA